MALREHLTPKQDAFAMAYVESGNAAEAYRRAYRPKKMSQAAIDVEACRTVQHPKVTLRIDELQRAHAERHEITVETLTAQLEEARQLAMSLKNPSAAVSATMGMAKLHGLLTDKLEHSGKDGAAPSLTLTINRRAI
jgi:phage terminase small subunit